MLQYQKELKEFAESLIQIQLDISGKESLYNIENKDKISVRGWCYQLEGFKTITKSQFDYCQRIINICRKEGYLPIDFVAQDEARNFFYVENLTEDYKTPEYHINCRLRWARDCQNSKKDVAFWESQGCYIQMMVEKLDVRNLFLDTCEKYHTPICNAKGWSDILSRYHLAMRFKEAEELGLKPVLLYYGDFDPAGIKIGENIKKNLKDIEKATEWNPDNLIVDVFGLTYEFIEENGLLWIDNLETGGKKDLSNPSHPDHNKPYVQDYLKKYGVRKCEANAILPIRKKAIKYCEAIITKYLGDDPFSVYDEAMKDRKEEVLELMEVIDLKPRIQAIIEDLREAFRNPEEWSEIIQSLTKKQFVKMWDIYRRKLSEGDLGKDGYRAVKEFLGEIYYEFVGDE